MLIKTLTVGQIETNCYVVTNENTLECVIIDPGDESNYIMNYLEENHLKCELKLFHLVYLWQRFCHLVTRQVK